MRFYLAPLVMALAAQPAVAASTAGQDTPAGTDFASRLPRLAGSQYALDADVAMPLSQQLEAGLAGLVAEAGQAMEEDPDAVKERLYKRLQGEARGYVSHSISSGIEGWLGSYGRARVQLGTGSDGDFSWEIDYLQPLYRIGKSRVLYALGSHRLDERTLADAGLIYRFGLAKDALLGTSLFVDQDLENGHSRASMGLEYMTPWWQLTGNYYTPLTDWKATDAPLDFAHADAALQERPASGYDLSLHGGLPRLPELHAQATLSHWMGEHVDLAGDQNTAETSPWSTGLTLNYQPVPLLTVSATHTFMPGKDDSRVRLLMSFNLDRTLAQQLQVVTGSAMFGNAPDLASRFVERNHRMVMHYRAAPDLQQRLHVSDVQVGRIPLGRRALDGAYGGDTIRTWSTHPGGRVLLKAQVTDSLGRPVAGVPVLWNISKEGDGINHGQILESGIPGADTAATAGSQHVLARAESNADGYVYLNITDSQAEESLLVSAGLGQEKLTGDGYSHLVAQPAPEPVPRPRRLTRDDTA